MPMITSKKLAYDDFEDSNVGAATTPAASPVVAAPAPAPAPAPTPAPAPQSPATVTAASLGSVSYTHLTLPTIYSV